MELIALISVTSIISYVVYQLFELFVRRNERIMLIEKLTELKEIKGVPIELPSLYHKEGTKFTSLRIGLTLLGIGLGIFLGVLLIFACMPEGEPPSRAAQRLTDILYSLPVAAAITLGGLGLATSYLIEKKIYFKEKKNK